MFKHSHPRLRWITLFGVLVALLMTVIPGKTIFAATTQKDPLVVIAVDATNTSHCTEVDNDGINTPHPVVKQFPCKKGTIVKEKIVTLSQATTLHEQYVLLSSIGNTQAQNPQLQKLMHAKGQSSLAHTLAMPATGCGQTNTHQVSWSSADEFDGITYNLVSKVRFTLSPSCAGVEILAAYVTVNHGACCSDEENHEHWDHDQYSDGWFGVPGTPQMNTGGNYWHGINLWYTAGYTYETWLKYYFYSTDGPLPEWSYSDIGVN